MLVRSLFNEHDKATNLVSVSSHDLNGENDMRKGLLKLELL